MLANESGRHGRQSGKHWNCARRSWSLNVTHESWSKNASM